MNVILTCGHPYSGYERVHQALSDSGLATAKELPRESMSAHLLHERIFKAYELDGSGLGVRKQLAPGKEWKELASELVVANAPQSDWGWADARGGALLEFWKSISPNLRFVLVYSAPESGVGRMIHDLGLGFDDIGKSLDSWIGYNDELLRFYHRNPERCLLVNISGARHDPAALVDKAAGKFGLAIRGSDAAVEPLSSHISLLAASLARGVIEESNPAITLHCELESASDINAAEASIKRAERQIAWQAYQDASERIHKLAAAIAAQAESEEGYRTTIDGLLKDGELQTVQLRQVQEELELLFAQQKDLVGLTVPAEITFDLRCEIEGDNWHEAESDGRWAGPGEVSTIRVAKTTGPRVELQLEVVDSMSPEILGDMRVSLNGLPIEVVRDSFDMPALFIGQFSTDEVPEDGAWVLRFDFPEVLSPSQQGSDDLRLLAIRLRAIRLRAIEETVRPESF